MRRIGIFRVVGFRLQSQVRFPQEEMETLARPFI